MSISKIIVKMVSVMVMDENGNCATVIGIEWGTEGYEETAGKWATFAYPLDHLRGENYAFSKIKSITLYARSAKAGTYSIDNIRYDKTNVGLMGAGVQYESELNLLLWDKVPYAREYEVKIGDKTYTSRANMLTTDALPVGAYEAEITAKNFESSRTATYSFEVKPASPYGVSYDEQIFSFDAVSGAEYYYIRAIDANGMNSSTGSNIEQRDYVVYIITVVVWESNDCILCNITSDVH